MLDAVRTVDPAVLSFGQEEWDAEGFTPAGREMTEQDWDSGFGKCVTVFLNGQGITEADSRGEVVTDDSFLLCLNAHHEDIEVTLPPPEYGTSWAIVVDTAVGEVLTLTTAVVTLTLTFAKDISQGNDTVERGLAAGWLCFALSIVAGQLLPVSGTPQANATRDTPGNARTRSSTCE